MLRCSLQKTPATSFDSLHFECVHNERGGAGEKKEEEEARILQKRLFASAFTPVSPLNFSAPSPPSPLMEVLSMCSV